MPSAGGGGQVGRDSLPQVQGVGAAPQPLLATAPQPWPQQMQNLPLFRGVETVCPGKQLLENFLLPTSTGNVPVR